MLPLKLLVLKLIPFSFRVFDVNLYNTVLAPAISFFNSFFSFEASFKVSKPIFFKHLNPTPIETNHKTIFKNPETGIIKDKAVIMRAILCSFTFFINSLA